MTLLRKGPEPERRWIFRPFYLSIIWLILALLLIINGAYEAKRAEENLYRMLLDEGLALIDGLEKNTQNVFASLATMEAFPEASALLISSAVNPMALEESIIDLVLEVAFQADHRIGGSSPGEDELRKITEEDHFDQIELITPQKRLFYHRNPSATEDEKQP
ncbi:MAG: hypothetical protein NTY64_11060 [Deltaproteobacteria bacterium]|nr:hypothetical protein [Deltaproteobacteria bacterium]